MDCQTSSSRDIHETALIGGCRADWLDTVSRRLQSEGLGSEDHDHRSGCKGLHEIMRPGQYRGRWIGGEEEQQEAKAVARQCRTT